MKKDLLVYNTLTKEKEVFVPINEDTINMYVCGITPSGDAHIGHAFGAVVFDCITKYLSYI